MDDKEIHADEHNFKQIAQINRAASFKDSHIPKYSSLCMTCLGMVLFRPQVSAKIKHNRFPLKICHLKKLCCKC